MIKQMEQIPITKISHPFGTATEKCGFNENGYMEEEYFIHGAANIYGWDNGKKVSVYPDADYVNRIVVRRPTDYKKFSGNVMVEILNSTSFIDFDRTWVLTYRHLMRNGDIYIGITSKPNVIPAMRKLDHKRYARLNWNNPRQTDPNISEDLLGNMQGASSRKTEDGLFWDMLIDLAKLLRNENEIISNQYGKYYQYLAGWSQSGAYMIRFINSFAYEEEREVPLFDGYFSCGSASSCMPDLNQSYGRTALVNNRKLQAAYQPFIEIHTESENQKWENTNARGENSNIESMKYRIYDIAGASHDVKASMIDYYFNDMDVFKSGIVPTYPGKEIYPNDYPYHLPFQAALQYLYDWVRKGIDPPVIEQIQVDEQYENIKDIHGNSVGGWRLPFVDYPVCTYMTECTPMKPDYKFACTLFGHLIPFTQEKYRSLYGDTKVYLECIKKAIEEAVLEGRMLKEDIEDCLSYVMGLLVEFEYNE